MERLLRTLQLVVWALKPRRLGVATPRDAVARELAADGTLNCEPGAIANGMGPLVNDRGEIRLCFPGCFALAAPALLFRLKREGFSACTVRTTDRGLLVQGRR